MTVLWLFCAHLIDFTYDNCRGLTGIPVHCKYLPSCVSAVLRQANVSRCIDMSVFGKDFSSNITGLMSGSPRAVACR
jgi:hypothetical protein